MSSKPIYPHVPYFYIIEHVASGKRYAGSRWAKGCHPSEFMTEDGYCTSSNAVHEIIKDEGINTFIVVEIKTVDEVSDVYEYETKFLTENDCANSNLWLTQHNNTGITFGTEEFKTSMLAKRGVEYALRSEVCKEKSKQTCLDRYGFEYSLQSEEVKSKGRKTCLARYGFEYAFQSDAVKKNYRQSMLKNHGVENPSQSDAVKEQKRQTFVKNYGVAHAMQTKEHKERQSKLNYKTFDSRVTNGILNGDFSRFVYLYDNIEHVFLMGVEKSLNRGLDAKRFVKITANKGYKKYIDISSGKLYYIDESKFSTSLPNNFILV